jgi:hypothetical protein
MSYHRRYYSSPSLLECMLPIILAVALLFALMLGVNMCSSDEWNDGFCPKCDVRYELRAVYRGRHYYVCPECGCEVQRY